MRVDCSTSFFYVKRASTTMKIDSLLRRTKAMKSKDRTADYACTNAAGVNVPMCIIEKRKTPSCYFIKSHPIPYLSKRSACSKIMISKTWILNVFFPFARRYNSGSIVLVMHHCGPHRPKIRDPRERIEVMRLLLNCTPMRQPVDMSVTALSS